MLNAKLEMKDIEPIENNLIQIKSDFAKKTGDFDQDIDNLIDNIKREFQNINLIIGQIDQSKVEFKDLDKNKY